MKYQASIYKQDYFKTKFCLLPIISGIFRVIITTYLPLHHVLLISCQMSEMYAKDPLSLDLALDYWCPPEPLIDSYQHRPPQKQVQ